jgi:hypothetical protein
VGELLPDEDLTGDPAQAGGEGFLVEGGAAVEIKGGGTALESAVPEAPAGTKRRSSFWSSSNSGSTEPKARRLTLSS